MSFKDNQTIRLRVALCQLDTTIGFFDHNVQKIIECLKKLAPQKVNIAIFPELCLSSYPPLDILGAPDFIQKNEKALEEVQAQWALISQAPRTIVLGSIVRNPGAYGRALQNAAVVLHEGKVVLVQPKRLLPTYDVFDEGRYFAAGQETTIWNSPWGKLGFSVCEDAWFDDLRHGRKLYKEDPAQSLKGADLVINISASPFELNKHKLRQKLLTGFVQKIDAPLIYVNQVGANDEILFDGRSLIYSEQGEVLFEMPSFEEKMAVVDLELGKKVKIIKATGGQVMEHGVDSPLEMELLYEGLTIGIRDYFQKTGFTKAVIGLSGGIDSSVVACLAAKALGPENVFGVSLPSQYSTNLSLTDAEALVKALGIHYQVLSIQNFFSEMLKVLKPAFGNLPVDATEENIQARLRAVILTALANKMHGLLLTTGNKSELAVGFCTIYGDMAGAIAPIGDVYKTKVYELARFINSKHAWIPASILQKPPSPELAPGQTTEKSLGSYAILDKLLEKHIEGRAGAQTLIEAGFEPAYVRKILQMVRYSEFKRRQAAPVLKVTSKAFGLGRRMPIVKSF